MFGIHSHILPGMDDGAQTIEESIEMARLAVQEGIHQIIATPHHMNGSYHNDRNRIIQRVEELNGVLDRKGIPLQVLPGQELRIWLII